MVSGIIHTKSISISKLIRKIEVFYRPDLKIKNKLFSIEIFFYRYPLIKKLVEKGNFFCYRSSTQESNKILEANLVRFRKRLRKNFLIDLDKPYLNNIACRRIIDKQLL